MCTPFPEALEKEDDRIAAFNLAQKRARNPVETTIGALKARFAVLMQGPRLKSMEDCSKLVQICCALHNYLLDKNYPLPDLTIFASAGGGGGGAGSEEAEHEAEFVDDELDDTVPLSVRDAGEPEIVMVDENPLVEMDKIATNQVLLDIFF